MLTATTILACTRYCSQQETTKLFCCLTVVLQVLCGVILAVHNALLSRHDLFVVLLAVWSARHWTCSGLSQLSAADWSYGQEAADDTEIYASRSTDCCRCLRGVLQLPEVSGVDCMN